jgi:hypothetical protein
MPRIQDTLDRPRARASCRWIARAVLLALVVPASAAPARAQSAMSSSIHGSVEDQSGAAVPGVTVTLTSPAIQVPQIVAVTAADGAYRFPELPAGVYQLAFELAGFRTSVREDLRLPVGFTMRVDTTMTVGALEETIAVRGQAPVVDLSKTSSSVNLTREALDTIPRGRGLWETVAMAPGVSTTRDAPDVGDSNLASRSPIVSYGSQATGKIEIEGVNVTTGAETNAGVYIHSFLFDEVQIKASGNDAEVSVPGVNFVSVVKSGSNTFKGTYLAAWQGPQIQSSNLSDELRAQGLTETDPLQYYFDVAGDLGGRIIKDKLWFYGAFARQKRVSHVLGFAANPGPDGAYLTADDEPADYESSLDSGAVKLSWQASAKHRLIGLWTPALKYQPQRDAGRFRPLESTLDYRHLTKVYKGELQSMLTQRLLFDAIIGYGGYDADYSAIRAGNSRPGNPSRQDRNTGLFLGPAESPRRTPRYRTMFDGGFSFFPERSFGGRHEMKAGWSLYWETTGNEVDDQPHGNYFLIYDTVAGAPMQPVEIQIRNWPVAPESRANVYAAYFKDTWHISDRVTANWGVRWEQQHSFVPAQESGASPQFPTLFPGGRFDEIDVLTWRRVVPRFGISWDPGGNGRSAVKATVGLYNHMMGDSFASTYSRNASATARFRWRDADGNGDYTPGEANLSTSGPDFISITGGNTNLLPGGLTQPIATEVTVGYERQLAENLAVRSLYVFKRDHNLFGTVNTLRPYGAYNIPLTRPDPGPDGEVGNADDRGMVTFYDYDPAYRGAAFVANQRQNSANDDYFHTLELSVTKRMSRRWMAIASGWFTKNHAWLTRMQSTPNEEVFPLDETWSWASTVSGSYLMPYDVQVSGFLQARAGTPGYREYTFRNVPQLGTVTLPLEPFGSQRGPAVAVLNVRASKQLALGGARRLSLDLDVFNLLNSNAAVAINWAAGPTFGYVQDLTQARVARLGVKYSF